MQPLHKTRQTNSSLATDKLQCHRKITLARKARRACKEMVSFRNLSGNETVNKEPLRVGADPAIISAHARSLTDPGAKLLCADGADIVW